MLVRRPLAAVSTTHPGRPEFVHAQLPRGARQTPARTPRPQVGSSPIPWRRDRPASQPTFGGEPGDPGTRSSARARSRARRLPPPPFIVPFYT